MLKQYKRILSSILPPAMLTDDGLLRMPSGDGEPIRFLLPPDYQDPDDSPWLGTIRTLWHTLIAPNCEGFTFYEGALYWKVVRHRMAQRSDSLSEGEYMALKTWVDRKLAEHNNQDIISRINPHRKAALVHETFHDIQGFLLDYHPEVAEKLFTAVDNQKEAITRWYRVNRKWAGPRDYRLEHFFPTSETSSPYRPDEAAEAFSFIRKTSGRTWDTCRGSLKLLADSLDDLGRLEAIPVLLSAAAEKNMGATRILSEVFREVGLNPFFHRTLPCA